MSKDDGDKYETFPDNTYRDVVMGFEKDEGIKPAIAVIIGENGRTRIWVNPFYTQRPHTAANMILGAADKLNQVGKDRAAAMKAKAN